MLLTQSYNFFIVPKTRSASARLEVLDKLNKKKKTQNVVIRKKNEFANI